MLISARSSTDNTNHIVLFICAFYFILLLNNMAPSYITELLTPYTPTRSLRSSDKSLLVVPRTKSSLGDRAFSVVAPKLWNSLPTDLRQATSLHHFKRELKTFLFNNAYVS